MVETFEKLIFAHSRSKENIRQSVIYENESVFFLNPGYRTLDDNFFDVEMRDHCFAVRNLQVKDIIREDGTALDHAAFCNITGINIREN
jgi:hypothetical protein